jgi:hypothetical protein
MVVALCFRGEQDSFMRREAGMKRRAPMGQQSMDKGGRGVRQLVRVAVCVFLLAPGMVQTAEWKPLPDTGQRKCYDTGGKEIPCPAQGQPLYGQDAQYVGIPRAYQDHGDETITDRNSGLMWMKGDDGTGRTWQDAFAYCDNLVFAGRNDWRLPNRFELDSIVDYGRSYPAINPMFRCQASFYWSSVPYAGDPVYAWGIYFNDGGDHWLDKINKYYVRCVRAGR